MAVEHKPLLKDQWSRYLHEIMELHSWSGNEVARMTDHSRSTVGYWLKKRTAPHRSTQVMVRQILEGRGDPPYSKPHVLKAFKKRWGIEG